MYFSHFLVLDSDRSHIKRCSSDVMSWGTELWDQTDNLSNHVLRGVDFVDRYGSFLKDRAQVESDYAKSLRALTKKYLVKKKSEDDPAFTYVHAFHGVVNELNDIASQHEVVSDRLKHEAVTKIHESVKELRELRRQAHEEIKGLQCNLDHQINVVLGRAKSDYIKAWKDARAAEVKHQKADADMNLSRAEVERSRNIAITKAQYAEKAKHTYALSLQNTNELQKQHYQSLLPQKLETLRKLDERRIVLLQNVIEENVKIERQVVPLIEKCFDGMLTHAQGISEQKDILHVIALYRSGYTPPQDLEFLALEREEDLEDGNSGAGIDSSDIGTYSSPPQSNSKLKNIKGGGTLRMKFSRPRSNRKAPPEPPQQKVNRIQQQLTADQDKLTKYIGERDGLLRLERVYQQDTTKGDLGAVQRARQAVEAEIAKLEPEIRRLEIEKTDAENELNTPIDIVVKDTLRHGKGHQKGSILRIPSIIQSTRSSMRGASSTSSHTNGSGDSGHHNGGDLPVSARDYPGGSSDCDGNSRSSTDTFDSGHHAAIPAAPPLPPELAGGVPTSSNGVTPVAPPAFSVPSSRPPAAHHAPPEAEYNVVADAADEEEVLGHARAAYPFDSLESGSDNTISIRAGDQLDILEHDDGDGWTRVKNARGEEGFVPTSYLEIL